jgi:co-chaperonin GroES (HSP10)
MESNVITACKGKVLVTNLDSGEQKTAGGIVLSDDDGKLRGIHSRWAKVYSVGEDITDIQVGEWILVEHGRWSRTISLGGISLNLVDYPKGVLCASPERPVGFIGLGR